MPITVPLLHLSVDSDGKTQLPVSLLVAKNTTEVVGLNMSKIVEKYKEMRSQKFAPSQLIRSLGDALGIASWKRPFSGDRMVLPSIKTEAERRVLQAFLDELNEGPFNLFIGSMDDDALVQSSLLNFLFVQRDQQTLVEGLYMPTLRETLKAMVEVYNTGNLSDVEKRSFITEQFGVDVTDWSELRGVVDVTGGTKCPPDSICVMGPSDAEGACYAIFSETGAMLIEKGYPNYAGLAILNPYV